MDAAAAGGPGHSHRRLAPRHRQEVPSLMDFSRVELSDEDQAFLDELRAFLATVVTDEVIARDRQTGENFDEGVHLALGAAGYLERRLEARSRRWLQPRCAGASGSWRSAGRTRRGSTGAQRPWLRRRLSSSARPSSRTRCCHGCCPASSGCALATPSRRAAPTWRRARPARCATATAGSSTAPRCSPPMRTTPSTSSWSPTPTRTRRSTRA